MEKRKAYLSIAAIFGIFGLSMSVYSFIGGLGYIIFATPFYLIAYVFSRKSNKLKQSNN